MNKKLKKGLTTTMAAAMGLGVVIPAVPVIAAPATSGWVNTAAGWTYYKSGVKATGWVLDGGKWYLLDSNGVMKTGWAKDAGTWYFLNASGAMATGWVKDTDGKWYFLNNSGAMVANTWAGNYYLGSTGAMAVSTVTADGWTVNTDGAWDGHSKAADLKAATDAVVAAEASLSQADIDAAKALVAKLTVTVDVTALTARLNAIVTTLQVSSVTAINSKELQVVFSQKIDKLTAETAANYTIAAVGGATFAATTPELQADGKTVILTLNAADNLTSTDTNYNVTVKDVKDLNGVELESDYVTMINLVDKARPSFTTAMSDSNTLKLTFSEPVNLSPATAFAAIKVYDGSTVTGLTQGNYTIGSDNKSVKIDVSTLSRATTYTLKAVGVKDFAGNLITPNPVSVDFTTVKDTTDPVINSITSLNLSEAKVVTSEPLTAVAGTYFTISIDGSTPANVGAGALTISSDRLSYTVDLTQFTAGNAALTKGVHYIKINNYSDLAGNAVATATTKLLTFAAAGPAITNTVGTVKDIAGTNYVVFPVDRPVTVTAGSTLTLGFTDADGIVQNDVTVTDASNAQLKALDLDNDGDVDHIGINADDINGTDGATVTPLAKGTYTATIGSIVNDTAPVVNPLDDTDVTFTIDASSTQGQVTGVVQTVASPNTVTVTFDKALDPISAKDVNNYKLDGVTIASNAVFYQNDHTVKLTLIPGTVPFDSSYLFTVSGVKDSTGTAIKNYSNSTITWKENTKPTATATFTSPSAIKVTFSESIGTTFNATDDVVVKVNGTTVTLAAPASVTAGTVYTLTKADGSAFITSASDNVTLSVQTSGATVVKDANGNSADTTTLTVAQ